MQGGGGAICDLFYREIFQMNSSQQELKDWFKLLRINHPKSKTHGRKTKQGHICEKWIKVIKASNARNYKKLRKKNQN